MLAVTLFDRLDSASGSRNRVPIWDLRSALSTAGVRSRAEQDSAIRAAWTAGLLSLEMVERPLPPEQRVACLTDSQLGHAYGWVSRREG